MIGPIDLNNDQKMFTESKLETAVIYFREFANLKIILAQYLRDLKQNDVLYENNLRQDAKEFIEAGEKMIKEVPKSYWKKQKNGERKHYAEKWVEAEIRAKIKV